ncbi:MAG TPA: lipopolysaccharide assembly protein LapA domain-containing protein [Acidimicrobiales bacterium]|nr:lipopolysaccharide assembly protein LapA domain-containing protein [Acidimicrobiales bacterium]
MPERAHDQKPGFGRPASTRQWASLAAGLLPLLAVAVFVLQNTDKVRVRFLFVDGRIALGLALLMAAVLGGVGALFLGFVRRHRRN